MAVSTLAGCGSNVASDGIGQLACIRNPGAVAASPDGTRILFTSRHSVRQIVLLTAAVTTLAGSTSAGHIDHTGTNARFNYPYGLVVSADSAYITDALNHRVRVL